MTVGLGSVLGVVQIPEFVVGPVSTSCAAAAPRNTQCSHVVSGVGFFLLLLLLLLLLTKEITHDFFVKGS